MIGVIRLDVKDQAMYTESPFPCHPSRDRLAHFGYGNEIKTKGDWAMPETEEIKQAVMKWRETEMEMLANKSDDQKQRAHYQSKRMLRPIADRLIKESKK